MSNRERRFMILVGTIAVLVLMLTSALVGIGGALLLFDKDGGLADRLESLTAAQPVRYEAPALVAGSAAVAEAAVQPLDPDRRAELDAAREALSSGAALQPLPLRDSAATGNDLSQLYEQVNPGVVSIRTRMMQGAGTGSGFVLDDRHVVTNNHVIEAADAVRVVFADGTERDGRVVGTDAYSDLAVIEVADIPGNARALPLVEDFDELKPGQAVVAMGNPFGDYQNTMTAGIISALGRTIPSDPESRQPMPFDPSNPFGQGGPQGQAPSGRASFSIPQTIQTDAAINPGNSGGPLVNMRGEVVGVNAQIRTQGMAANAGVGFAIPSSIVARVVPTLIAEGRYEWSYLGVSGGNVVRDVAERNGLDPDARGAYINEVMAGGPSIQALRGSNAVAGGSLTASDLMVGGDVVVAIDDTPVRSFDDLLTYVALETQPGDTVELTIVRGGQELVVPLRLGARPRSDS